MGALLDALVLLAVAKEAVVLRPILPFSLWASIALALPFFLGMAASLRIEASIAILRNPWRALIAQGLSATMLLLFLAGLASQPLVAAYWTLVVMGGAMYLLGRVLGFMMRSLLFLVAVLIVVIWLGGL